jgi:uncharacterized BrkB/YihY/UPF0761 family membrane protein
MGPGLLKILLMISLPAFVVGAPLLVAIAVREQHQPDFFEDHPLLPLLMIGFGLLALATAFIAALFAVWMLYRLIATRPALSAGAAAAAEAPARSAG